MVDAVQNPAPTPSGASDQNAVTPPVVTPVAAAPATPEPPAPVAPAPAPAEPAKPAESAKPAEPAKPVVPEKYDFAAVKLPEGMVLDQPLIDAVAPVLKELGLPQEAANKLVEAHAKAVVAAETKREADFKEWMKTNVTNYQTKLKSEWGNAYDANLVTAQRGMARIFSPEAKALLDETGLGNHPEFVKAFLQVGKMVSEDTLPGQRTPGSTKSLEAVLYPTMVQTPASH